jgi:hypothetical protein
METSTATAVKPRWEENMKRLYLLLVSLIAASCGHTPATGPPSILAETVTVQIGPPTSVPRTPTTTLQCLHSFLDASWPVEKVITEWNRNSVNTIEFYAPIKTCTNHILMYEAYRLKDVQGDVWGSTQYNQESATTVLVAADVPAQVRQHVLCHELGHALGLPHEKGDTCMNIEKTYPLPGNEDLQTLQKKIWEWPSAMTSAGLH